MNFAGLEVTWLGHAAVRIRTDDGTTVLIDPWLKGNPSCPESEHAQERVDAIFLTHGHFDHVGDTLEIARATGAQVHAIHEIALWLESQDTKAVGSNKGGTVSSVGGIKASLTDAVHSSGISGDSGIIPGGEAGGWVLEFPGGPTLYHAGDTMVFGDMALIRDIWKPDVAFLPIGGWYTMGPEQATIAGRVLEVEAVVPIHFGTFPILDGTPSELAEGASGAFEVAQMEIGVPVR